MKDDGKHPWWLEGESGEMPRQPPRPARDRSSGPYGVQADELPPLFPPIPTHEPNSGWLRDAPSVPMDAQAAYPDPNGWQPSPRRTANARAGAPPPPLVRRRPVATSAPPPPPPTATHNPFMRPLLGLFVVLLIVTVGVGLWRSNLLGGNNPAGITFPGFGPPAATATPTGFAQSATISFTRLTKTIAAPSSTLVAATDGSGQIKATAQNASVSQVTTAGIAATHQAAQQVVFTLAIHNTSNSDQTSIIGLSIKSSDGKVTCTLGGTTSIDVPAQGNAQQLCAEPAQLEPIAQWDYNDLSTGLVYTGSSKAGGNEANYYVPTNCGDASTAQQAAQAALQQQLTLPAGSAVLFKAMYNIDPKSLTCTPAANTAKPTAFTYTQMISGTATQTIYDIAVAQNYQLAQLKTKIPTNYVLVDSSVCPDGPLVGTDATATHATLTCPTTGTSGWNWTPVVLQQLAASVAGASTATAQLQVNNTMGIVAGTVKIVLVAGSEMPQAASAITFSIKP